MVDQKECQNVLTISLVRFFWHLVWTARVPPMFFPLGIISFNHQSKNTEIKTNSVAKKTVQRSKNPAIKKNITKRKKKSVQRSKIRKLRKILRKIKIKKMFIGRQITNIQNVCNAQKRKNPCVPPVVPYC